MKSIRSLLAVLLFAGSVGLGAEPIWAQALPQGLLFAAPLAPGINYCHLEFPAIQERTLNSDRPVLKDGGTGDVIDFYGPCDHNPLGKDEIRAQTLELEHRRANDYSS